MLACAAVTYTMQELTGVSYNTSEQRKDTFKARQEHDTVQVAPSVKGIGSFEQ